MKTYHQLTDEQKVAAKERALICLLEHVLDGSIRFNDEMNDDDLQKRIDAALAFAEKNHTPWFAGEYIMETCSDELKSMASCDAENALYSEPDELVIPNIVV